MSRKQNGDRYSNTILLFGYSWKNNRVFISAL